MEILEIFPEDEDKPAAPPAAPAAVPPASLLVTGRTGARVVNAKAVPVHAGGRTSFVPPILRAKFLEAIQAHQASGAALSIVGLQPLFIGIVKAYNFGYLLTEEGGYWSVSPSWIKKFIRSHNLVKRRATTAAQHVPDDYKELIMDFKYRLSIKSFMEQVPPECILNFDQTGMLLCPAGKSTYAVRGTKSVPVIGADDKRQITLVVGVTASGVLLPPQLIFAGTTTRSLPPKDVIGHPRFKGWDFVYTESHWSNISTTIMLFDNIIGPYLAGRKGIVILDCFRPHLSQEVRDHVRTKYPLVHLLYVPAGCTSIAQPCDTGVQRPLKCALTKAFQGFVSETITAQVRAGATAATIHIDTRISTIKPRVPGFVHTAYSSITPETVRAAWRKAGLLECLTPVFAASALLHKERLFPSAAASDDPVTAGVVAHDGGVAEQPAVLEGDDDVVDDDVDDFEEDETPVQLLADRVFEHALTLPPVVLADAPAPGNLPAAAAPGVPAHRGAKRTRRGGKKKPAVKPPKKTQKQIDSILASDGEHEAESESDTDSDNDCGDVCPELDDADDGDDGMEGSGAEEEEAVVVQINDDMDLTTVPNGAKLSQRPLPLIVEENSEEDIRLLHAFVKIPAKVFGMKGNKFADLTYPGQIVRIRRRLCWVYFDDDKCMYQIMKSTAKKYIVQDRLF